MLISGWRRLVVEIREVFLLIAGDLRTSSKTSPLWGGCCDKVNDRALWLGDLGHNTMEHALVKDDFIKRPAHDLDNRSFILEAFSNTLPLQQELFFSLIYPQKKPICLRRPGCKPRTPCMERTVHCQSGRRCTWAPGRHGRISSTSFLSLC